MTNLFQVSSVPAFQDALIAALKARTALANISIVPGLPAPGVAMESQWICLLEAVGIENWAAMGRLSREELYEQKVYISVVSRDGEGTAKFGRDVAFGLRSEIAEELRVNPTVGGSVWQTQIKKPAYHPRLGIPVPDAAGGMTVDLTYREAAIYFDIEVRYRMTHV